MPSTSPILCTLIAAALFALPWTLMPDGRGRPEIRGALRLLWVANRAYCAFLHRLRSNGPAPLPARGPALVVANHTCGIDHLLLQATSGRILSFLIAQEFYDYWPLRPFCRALGCIPVRRDGRDLAATRAALRALEDGRVVPIFPEGRILPTSGREIGPGRPGAAFIALKAAVPVIPAYISGTPPTNDVFRVLITPSSARVVYGEPIDLARFRGAGRADHETLGRVTDLLMGSIKALRDRPPAEGV